MFQTFVTVSVSDMVSKVSAFLEANSWTVDQLDLAGGKAAWNDGTTYVSVRWESSSSLYMGIYQALGFINTSTAPGNHTNDSGNGAVSGTDSVIALSRRALVGPAPLQLWCFSGDGYAHFVLQQLTARYTHFGWGMLNKVGTWTGGSYAYGTRQQFGFSTPYTLEGGTCLLDGLAKSGGSSPQPGDMELYVATVHAEGLPNQGGTSKWAVVMSTGEPNGTSAGQLGVDRASVARIHFIGGLRAGFVASSFGSFAGITTKAHVPQYPLVIAHFDRTTGDMRIVGSMPGVRGMSIQNFAAGDRVARGGVDWMVFPCGEKWISGDLANTTSYVGVSYEVVD